MFKRLIQFLGGQSNSKKQNNNSKVNRNIVDIIEVDHYHGGVIPERTNQTNTKITNTQFKSVKLLSDLSSEQIFYINSLDLGYARQFEDKEFLELQTIKLYLDLCQQTNTYLKQKNSSLEKKSKEMSYGYMSYNNTFYSLYFISEISVEEFYYGRSQKSVNYSFSLLKKQIDSEIEDYLKEFLDIRLRELPEVVENLRSHIYSNLNSYQILGLAFKRLGLDDKQKSYLETIQFYVNIFTEIEQCLDETIKLYLKSITYILNKCNQYDRESVLKAFNSIPKKNDYGWYNSSIYESSRSKILQAVFSICQNRIKESYEHIRLEDIAHNKEYLTRKLGKDISEDFEKFVSIYEPEKPTKVTQIALNAKNKTRWKNALKKLLESNLDIVELKIKCDELLENNSKNSSQYLIYLELCKIFAKNSKTSALWYYYKYYELLTFKNSASLNLPEAKPLPISIVKSIFGTNNEKLKKFEFICKSRDPINHNDEIKKEEIKNLFKAERKEMKLDISETKKVQEIHSQITNKLNQVLQEESDLVEHQKESAVPALEAGDPENSKKENNQINYQSGSLQDFFNSNSVSNRQTSSVDFTDTEYELLGVFKENVFELTESQITNFAKSKKVFKSSMIQKINQKFYEVHEDNLIQQEEGIYSIATYNQNLI